MRPSTVIYSLSATATAVLLLFVCWVVGLTPASTQERQFIDMLASSSFQSSPQVAAVVHVAAQAPYISRRHFLAAEKAFAQVSLQTSSAVAH